jgi:hypothetical protein
MTDDPTFHEDYQLQALVRDYDRQKDGWSGLVERIGIFLDAHKRLESERRFDRFCERVHLHERIERDMMHHFVRRLEKLESILGSLGNLEFTSFCVFHLLKISRSEFESAIEFAANCSDTDAGSLFRDCVDDLVTQVSRMKPGGPDKDIYGMTWKTEKPPLRAIDDE